MSDVYVESPAGCAAVDLMQDSASGWGEGIPSNQDCASTASRCDQMTQMAKHKGRIFPEAKSLRFLGAADHSTHAATQSTGLRRSARKAGGSDAASAAARMHATGAARLAGSVGFTPKS